jgi:hypothetical protein
MRDLFRNDRNVAKFDSITVASVKEIDSLGDPRW